MAINFPDSPSVNDTHTVGDKTWVWNGTVWSVVVGAVPTTVSELTISNDLTVLGDITVGGTVDGRDVATDGTKLDGIETGADVTDATNVQSSIEAITLTSVAGATADEVLIVDATDGGLKAVLWENLPSGGGGGSPGGSDGQVQYNNGGAFGGASALYYDDVNSRVGIGTTSPAYALDVDGDINMRTGHSFYYDVDGATNPNPVFWIDGENTDIDIIRVGTDQFATDSDYGMTLKYRGSGSGVANTFDIEMDNQAGTQVTAISIFQNGDTDFIGALSANSISTNTASVTLLNHSATSSYDKIRVWSSASYTIGMVSGITHGALNDYAMTFRMNNDNDRGFWWGDDAHGVNQGAMSLSTDGRLYVSTSVKCGFGQTNTGNTFAYGLEVGGLTRVTQDGSSVYWYNQAISTAGNGQRAGIGMRNDGSNNSTVQLRPSGGYLYVRTWDDGTGVIMRADSYQNYSTMRDKQDVTDWGAPKSVGAAVDPAYAIDATEMVRNLRPVKFRRTKHHRLSADIQNHNERRGRALDRLNTIRRSKGLEEYHTDETVHQCGRDCEGSPESPCKLYRDWEKGEVGFIAEEVVNVVPDAVSTDDDEQPLTIDPMTLIATCVKALQEIDTRLTSLEAL